MKFEIGNRVRYFEDKNILNRYIVLATKEQSLNTDYLNSLPGSFAIHDFQKLAENCITTVGGYDYVICREEDFFKDFKSLLTGQFINVQESDISG